MTTHDKNSLLEMARDLAAHFAANATAADQQSRLFPSDIHRLRKSGYLALNIPREFGGLGLNMHDSLAAHLELSKGSAAIGIIAAMQLQVFGHMVDTHQFPDSVIERLCRLAVEGGLFNTAASEPRMGSPSRGGQFESTAAPHPDGWIINGHKTWLTGGQHLTHILVKLSIEDDPAMLLVEANRGGLHWESTWQHALSLRASESDALCLEKVVVPTQNLLQRGHHNEPPNGWFPMALATTYLGAAMAARDTVIRFALERVPTALGKPIATLPNIQRQIGDIDLRLQAAQALLFEVAGEWTGDNAHAIAPRIATAKHFAVDVANDVTEKALRVAGGQSLSSDLPLERYFRDARAGLMQPPAGDTALEIIGRAALAQIDESQ